MSWIDKRIESATWVKFAVWFVILFAFSAWAFNMDGPWTRALAAGGGVLPESQPGFHAAEPALSLGRLGEAKGDYLLWQVLDLPYAFFNLMALSLGMALGLKKTGFQKSPLRFLLLLPVIYVGCELVENSLVALFATGKLAMEGGAVQAQQAVTTLKFATGLPSLLLGFGGAAVAALAQLARLVFRKKA